jgi:hypothetical protein
VLPYPGVQTPFVPVHGSFRVGQFTPCDLESNKTKGIWSPLWSQTWRHVIYLSMIRLAIQNPKPAIKPYTKSFANIMIIIVIGSSMVLSPDVPVNEPIPNKLNEIFFTGHFLVTPFSIIRMKQPPSEDPIVRPPSEPSTSSGVLAHSGK